MNYLCVDVGGSAVKYAIMDEAYRIFVQNQIRVTAENHQDFVDAIAALYHNHEKEVVGLAISYCGEVDPNTGEIFNGGTYAYNRGHRLTESLKSLCSTKITIENDGNCAALAEIEQGNLRGCKNIVVLTLGSGVGCAVVLDGKIHHGTHCFSGCMSIAPKDIGEAYDMRNSLAGGIGMTGLIAGYAMAAKKDMAEVNGKYIFDRVAAGDPLACGILDRYCRNIANEIFCIQMLLDVEGFALGGGVSAQPLLEELVRKHLDAIYADGRIQDMGVPKPTVVRCRDCNDANLIGALIHHMATEE